MKKVLIITYYWPPAGGGGVQRWLKFSKYLGDYGWQPVIYTPSNGELPVVDESLLQEIPADLEVVKRPIWEPYSLYKSITGRRQSERLYSGFLNEKKGDSVAQKISVFIRGNFFIPDARCFWVRPSVRFLKHYIAKNPVDVIISTGPPHSMHLIAMQLKRSLPIPWIADFRDPWTNIDFYHQLRLTKWADNKHRRLEKQVLQTADEVVTVSPTEAASLQRIVPQRKQVRVITNGFDDADFAGHEIKPSADFVICHAGSMNKDRNPINLWKILGTMVRDNPEFAKKLRLQLIGLVDAAVKDSIVEAGLERNLEKVPFMAHATVLPVIRQAQVLLLLINHSPNAKGVLTGKLFEYLGAGRPILCIGPSGSDSEWVIRQTAAGHFCGYDDLQAIQTAVLDLFKAYQQGTNTVSPQGIGRYSRKQLAGRFAALLDELTKLTTL